MPDSILLNAGRLSEDEWKIMQQHPEHGYRILEKIPFLALACRIVLCHEERYDGSGYPSHLKGDEIPLPARLFAVIDTLDAMTFDRPYRKALPFDEARQEIVAMSGRPVRSAGGRGVPESGRHAAGNGLAGVPAAGPRRHARRLTGNGCPVRRHYLR